ncbi:SusC/RagA family TonB-linked outer membrane protein [Sinomicrobium soli]|nr:SusC/RagA family TonB-linked outer membrane protein [Sinomicrobium sp. N-1-3-6]
MQDVTIDSLLRQVFRDRPVEIQIFDTQIFLTGNPAGNTGSPNNREQQAISVKGTVTDAETDIPIPGASVVELGTDNGIQTDFDGKFSIAVPSDATLEISFLGYATQRISVEGRTEITVALEVSEEALEEVVVVGFGTQRKISLVGAQSTVKAEDLQNPVANLTNSMVGRLSGVIGVQRTGEPGFDDSDIWIRGISTFSQGLSKPLILVDGVPRSMSNVDPEDIESFTVLKDASATAVYGVRGANGVVIITTKKGKPGKPKFSLRYYEGLTQFTKLPEFADGPTYMRMSNEAIANRGGVPIYSEDEIRMTAEGTDPYLYPNVDWMSELFNDFGHQRRANLNINGGSENATFYVGLGYFDEVGLYKQGDVQYDNQVGFKRYNLTSNLEIRASETTTVNLGIQGYLANANYPGSGQGTIFSNAFYMTPVVHPVMYENGEIADQRQGSLANPYAHLTRTGYANQWRNQLFSNLRVTQKIPYVKGLSATAMFSFDVYNYTSMRRTKRPDTYLATGRDEDGNMMYEETYRGERYLSFSRNSNGERTIYWEAALNYDRTFDEKHQVTGMFLFNKSDRLDSQAGDFNSSLPYRYLGFSGRGTYGYDNRYFAELNFGYNGSENFNPDNRFGFFPSVGLGWVLSEEKFFEPLREAVPMLKFRFSHGKVGNSQITGRRFAYLTTIKETGGYSYGRERNNNYDGYDIGEYGVDVAWETAVKTNLGLDIYTLGSDLNLQVDFFKERREGIFLNREAVPAYVGLQSAPFGNLGIIENKGVDGSFTYSKRWNDFYIQALGNFTFSRNEIIENDKPVPSYPWMDQRGQKVGQRFGYNALGLFETQEEIDNGPLHPGLVQPGDIKFQDVNGDGLINDFDKIPIGYGTIPEIVYGFGLTVGYKQWSLSTLFQGVGNVDIFANGEGVVPFPVSMSRGNLLSNIDNRWTEEDPRQDVFYPRLSDGSPNSNYESSTWWVKNGRYLRLKNAQLNYQLSDDLTSRIGFDNVTFFLSGYNLLTWSPFDLWDVELGDGRGAAYPNVSTFALGVDLKF